MENQYQPVNTENSDDLLKRYHGFHDAQYGHIMLRPDPKGTGIFECSVLLWAHDYEQNRPVEVEFFLSGVNEFQIKYNAKYDYPNIRDDIAIAFYEGMVYINLGFATEPSVSPDDIRSSDIFFICKELLIRVVDRAEKE